MAHDDAKQPLLPGLLDRSPQPARKNSEKKKWRRCRSAPIRDTIGQKKDSGNSHHRFQTIFSNFHPSFKKVILLLAIYLGIGALVFALVSNQIKGKKTNKVLDAIYFCIVTMTTVGYGDLVPNSTLTKLLACAFVFTGMALVGLTLGKAADYLVEKQEELLVRAMNMHKEVSAMDVIKDFETNRLKYKFFLTFGLLLVLIIVGTLFLYGFEKLSLVDAFYCVCTTITTLGYGDKSFSTEIGRVFGIFWILTSTICVAQFFLYLAELNTERRRRSLVKWVLSRRMTSVDLEAADFDEDGVVGAAEFALYKLKEMGKITEEDISLIMQEFDRLDVDQSGTISVSDIILAQSGTISASDILLAQSS